MLVVGSRTEQTRGCCHVQTLVGPQGVVGVHPFVEGGLGSSDVGECACLIEEFTTKGSVESFDLASCGG